MAFTIQEFSSSACAPPQMNQSFDELSIKICSTVQKVRTTVPPSKKLQNKMAFTDFNCQFFVADLKKTMSENRRQIQTWSIFVWTALSFFKKTNKQKNTTKQVKITQFPLALHYWHLLDLLSSSTGTVVVQIHKIKINRAGYLITHL